MSRHCLIEAYCSPQFGGQIIKPPFIQDMPLAARLIQKDFLLGRAHRRVNCQSFNAAERWYVVPSGA